MDYGKSAKITHQRITMLKFFETVKDYDTLCFIPVEGQNNSLNIIVSQHKNAGEPVGGSPMGPEWHVVLFKSENDAVGDLDHFDAILTDPREYVSSLIEQDWYGMVSRKTTTSKEFVEKVLTSLKECDKIGEV